MVMVKFAVEIVSSRVRVPGDGRGAAREEVVGERAGIIFEGAVWESCVMVERELLLLLLLLLVLGCRRGVGLRRGRRVEGAVVGERRRRSGRRRREVVMVVVVMRLRVEGSVAGCAVVLRVVVVVVVEEVVLIHWIGAWIPTNRIFD